MREGEGGRRWGRGKEREREPLFMFSASFFSVHYFSHALLPSWAPKGGRGTLPPPPPGREISGTSLP